MTLEESTMLTEKSGISKLIRQHETHNASNIVEKSESCNKTENGYCIQITSHVFFPPYVANDLVVTSVRAS